MKSVYYYIVKIIPLNTEYSRIKDISFKFHIKLKKRNTLLSQNTHIAKLKEGNLNQTLETTQHNVLHPMNDNLKIDLKKVNTLAEYKKRNEFSLLFLKKENHPKNINLIKEFAPRNGRYYLKNQTIENYSTINNTNTIHNPVKDNKQLRNIKEKDNYFFDSKNPYIANNLSFIRKKLMHYTLESKSRMRENNMNSLIMLNKNEKDHILISNIGEIQISDSKNSMLKNTINESLSVMETLKNGEVHYKRRRQNF